MSCRKITDFWSRVTVSSRSTAVAERSFASIATASNSMALSSSDSTTNKPLEKINTIETFKSKELLIINQDENDKSQMLSNSKRLKYLRTKDEVKAVLPKGTLEKKNSNSSFTERALVEPQLNEHMEVLNGGLTPFESEIEVKKIPATIESIEATDTTDSSEMSDSQLMEVYPEKRLGMTPEEKSQVLEKLLLIKETKKMKQKEKRAKKRQKKKEKRKIIDQHMADLNKSNEDQDLEDFKPLPSPTLVDSPMPQELFGVSIDYIIPIPPDTPNNTAAYECNDNLKVPSSPLSLINCSLAKGEVKEVALSEGNLENLTVKEQTVNEHQSLDPHNKNLPVTRSSKLNFKKDQPKPDTIEDIDATAPSETKRTKLMKLFKERLFIKPQEMARIQEKKRLIKETIKAKKIEVRAKKQRKKKDERKIVNQRMAEFSKPREDLELEDLKPMPSPTPIDCRIPQELFGDFICVLEFLNHFGRLLSLEDTFPRGVNFDHLEQALTETYFQGLFHNLLAPLLSTIIRIRGKEGCYENNVEPAITDEKVSEELAKAIHEATIASRQIQTHHGLSLSKMLIDSFTISEMVRLHLLCSGTALQPNAKDDPALNLRMENSSIFEQLKTISIFQLPIESKLMVLKTLVSQLLNTDLIKDAIEDNYVDKNNLSLELDQLKMNFRKSERLLAKPLQPEEPEIEDEMEKKLKEKLGRKEEFLLKEKDIKFRLHKLQPSCNLLPLGRDRTYRRFYIFPSLPGLFVENNDPFVGDCLVNATPIDLPQVVESPSIMDKFLQSSKKKKLPDNLQDATKLSRPYKPIMSNPKLNSNFESPFDDDCSMTKEIVTATEDIKKQICTCTASSTCTVHKQCLPKAIWAFYHTEQDIDQLISSLNPRGIRESLLRKQIEQSRVFQFFKDCPAHRLNKNIQPPDIPEFRKSLGRAFPQTSKFSGMDPQKALELAFCQLILELEERIYCGNLGHIKDRDEWRDILQHRKYNEVDSKQEKGESALVSLNDVISILSQALAYVAKSVDPTCLRYPIGETKELEKQKLTYSSELATYNANPNKESVSPPKPPVSTFERWESSLKKCTSFSQLFVFIGTLESSLVLDNSLVDVFCKLCWYKNNLETMLLCVGCNRGFHMGCLNPPLLLVPSGDWFCSTCKLNKAPSSSHNREMEENCLQGYVCDSCSKVGFLILCDGCPLSFHLKCLQPPLKRVPPGNWYCPTCEPKDTLSLPCSRNILEHERDMDVDEDCLEEDSEEDSEDFDDDVCDSCSNDGFLICCDGCPLSFHLKCAQPPLKRVPSGKWFCITCRPKDTPSSDRKRMISEHEEDWDMKEDCQDCESEEENEYVDDDRCASCSKVGFLILCDGCPLSFHLKCVQPPLKQVPPGNWFCVTCRPKNTRSSARKRKISEHEGEHTIGLSPRGRRGT